MPFLFNARHAIAGTADKMQDRIRFLLNNRYPLSEELKNTEAFKKIINSLS